MKRKPYSTDALPKADPHSRADTRRKRQKEEAALLELAGQLVLLEELDVDHLDLPDEVRDAVATARSSRRGKPRARALRARARHPQMPRSRARRQDPAAVELSPENAPPRDGALGCQDGPARTGALLPRPEDTRQQERCPLRSSIAIDWGVFAGAMCALGSRVADP
jgi:hypothetical protein